MMVSPSIAPYEKWKVAEAESALRGTTLQRSAIMGRFLSGGCGRLSVGEASMFAPNYSLKSGSTSSAMRFIVDSILARLNRRFNAT